MTQCLRLCLCLPRSWFLGLLPLLVLRGGPSWQGLGQGFALRTGLLLRPQLRFANACLVLPLLRLGRAASRRSAGRNRRLPWCI